MAPRAVIFFVAFAVSSGCSDVTNESVADPAASLDETVFRCNVEPILARQCSYNGCHGNAGAAFRVYTPGKLRASPPASLDDQIMPLTTAEEHANFESASGFAYGLTAVEDNFLLRKPLPATAGGYEHKGGAIYAGKSDAQYAAIDAWLSGTGACK
jgi:hypothetical protein